MMGEKTRSGLRKLGVKLIAAALILIGLAFIVDLSFRPIVETVNYNECHAAVSAMITRSIAAERKRFGVLHREQRNEHQPTEKQHSCPA